MADDMYKKYLADKHTKMATPRELIALSVQRAAGSLPKSMTRIIKGHDHEVYDVITVFGSRVIVRIAHQTEHRLEAERWALNAARAYGVPTPRVLLLEQTEYKGKLLMICIEEKMPGRSLNELIDAGEDASALIPQLGEMLGHIHSVKTEGFGYLQPDGKGWDIPWREIMLDLVDEKEHLLTAARKELVSEQAIETGLKILTKRANLYECDLPVLNHGDFIPTHILVENNQITGIIDMQQCSGNHPVLDFARWEAEAGEKYSISAQELFATYPHQAAFGGKFDLLLNLALLRHALWMLMVESDTGNSTGVEAVKNELERALKFFKKDAT